MLLFFEKRIRCKFRTENEIQLNLICSSFGCTFSWKIVPLTYCSISIFLLLFCCLPFSNTLTHVTSVLQVLVSNRNPECYFYTFVASFSLSILHLTVQKVRLCFLPYLKSLILYPIMSQYIDHTQYTKILQQTTNRLRIEMSSFKLLYPNQCKKSNALVRKRRAVTLSLHMHA